MHGALRYTGNDKLSGVVEQKGQQIDAAQLQQHGEKDLKALERPGFVHYHRHQGVHGPAEGIGALSRKHGAQNQADYHEDDPHTVGFHKGKQTAHGAFGVDRLRRFSDIHVFHALISSSDNWLRTISW